MSVAEVPANDQPEEFLEVGKVILKDVIDLRRIDVVIVSARYAVPAFI
ncbi:MAG: hypothetical protein ACYDDN_10280 [Candidatus Desulforudaceae bacterium]|jgi:hypothetical protein|nr:hypothetical protein [Eubacteriales bacterium]